MENSSAEKKISHNLDKKDKIKPSKSKLYLNGEKKDEPKQDWSVNQDSGHGKEKTKKLSGMTKKQQNTNLEKPLKASQTQREKSGDSCKREKAGVGSVSMESERPMDDGFETPSMSFEAYLSYDLQTSKRRRAVSAARSQKKRLKPAHTDQSCVSLKASKTVGEEPRTTVPQTNWPFVLFFKSIILQNT